MSERLSKVPEVAHTKEDLGEIMEDACKLCTGLSSEGAHLVGMKLTRLVLDYISYILYYDINVVWEATPAQESKIPVGG